MSQKPLARKALRQLAEGPPSRRSHSNVLVGTLLITGALSFGPAIAQTSPSVPGTSTSTDKAAPAPLTTEQQTLLSQGQAALAARNYATARAAFETLVAQRYDSAEAHFGLGLALYSLNDLPGARFEFTQLIKLDPNRYEGYFNLGVVDQRAEQFDQALQNYSRALELARNRAPKEAVLPILDAIAAEQSRRNDNAGLAATLTERLALDTNNNDVRLALATATFRAGRGEDALPVAFEVLQRTPANEAAGMLIADIFEAQGLPDRALRELNKAIVPQLSDASRARLFVRRAALQSTLKQPLDATTSLRVATRLDPKNTVAWSRLGELAFSRGDRTLALEAWQGAVKADEKNVLYRVNLATVQLALGQLNDARFNAQLARISVKDPSLLARANFVSGVAAYRQGRFEAARDDLTSAAVAGADADTLLWLGLSEYALQNYEAAASALAASVRANPTLVSRANLGAALLASGHYPEAEVILRALVTDDPKNGEAWYNLGWAIRAQGRTVDARAAFQTSANLGYAKAKGELR